MSFILLSSDQLEFTNYFIIYKISRDSKRNRFYSNIDPSPLIYLFVHLFFDSFFFQIARRRAAISAQTRFSEKYIFSMPLYVHADGTTF